MMSTGTTVQIDFFIDPVNGSMKKSICTVVPVDIIQNCRQAVQKTSTLN